MATLGPTASWSGNTLNFYDGSGNVIFSLAAGSKMVGVPQHFRRRCTTAEINAGVDLLPAVPGFKYRLIDATLIAIGGNAATATAVIITGVQGASTVSLISAAVAALTQSAVVKPNSSNVTVLADGASFVQNDVNTKIAAAKTGSNLATATAVDVLLHYVLEP
jgi:hypothetical protein